MLTHPLHLHLASVRRPRFSRLPRQQQPDRQRETYYAELAPLVDDTFQAVEMFLVPALGDVVREAGYRQDSAEYRSRFQRWDDLGLLIRAVPNGPEWWDIPTFAPVVRRVARTDAWSDTLAAALARVAQWVEARWPHSRLERLTRRVALVTSTFQRQQLLRQFQHAFGITDLFERDAWLPEREKVWVDQNLRLIKSLPADALDDLHERITYGVRRGERAEGLARMLRERHGVQKRRAALISRDQTAKWYADLNRERQREVGVDAFLWRSMHDNRVCPVCEPLDGQRFTWASPPPEGLPGECHPDDRCYAEPDLEAFWTSLHEGGRAAA